MNKEAFGKLKENTLRTYSLEKQAEWYDQVVNFLRSIWANKGLRRALIGGGLGYAGGRLMGRRKGLLGALLGAALGYGSQYLPESKSKAPPIPELPEGDEPPPERSVKQEEQASSTPELPEDKSSPDRQLDVPEKAHPYSGMAGYGQKPSLKRMKLEANRAATNPGYARQYYRPWLAVRFPKLQETFGRLGKRRLSINDANRINNFLNKQYGYNTFKKNWNLLGGDRYEETRVEWLPQIGD